MLFDSLEVFADPRPRAGAVQMAADEILLHRAQVPLLRYYRWDRPQVTFGFTQSLREVREEISDLPLTRRWTAGGIVPHGGDWTFSLIIPRSASFARIRPGTSYALIHEAVAKAMQQAGVTSRLARAAESSSGLTCFTHPAEHDVLGASGSKLCGGAQRRTREGILHQGSLQEVEIPADFLEILAGVLCTTPRPFSQPPSEEEITLLASAKYATPEWLGRRA